MSKKAIKAKPRTKPADGYRWEANETYKDGELVAREWVQVRDRELSVLEEELLEDGE